MSEREDGVDDGRAARSWRVSPNLALDRTVAERRSAGQSVLHLGFGEARLPVLPELVRRLTYGARRTAYGAVGGDGAVRRSAAGYFTRRGLETRPGQTVLAPGSKPLLAALFAALDGDVLLPNPSWVTYAPQAELFRRRVHRLPVPDRWGGVPEPEALRTALRKARRRGRRAGTLVLTLPDNPTGTTAPPELVREVCALARDEGVTILSDEIYRDLPHRPDVPFLSPAAVAPERTVVLTGLSKSLALGGWRIGFARFPDSVWGRRLHGRVLSVASEVWSTPAGPMQEVAAYALAEPAPVRERLAASARLHGAVAAEAHRVVVSHGAVCRPPSAGFYVYPDFEPLRARIARHGVRDSASLQRFLLERTGVAVLGGHHFGDTDGGLRFRAATSLLYGESEEEQAAALAAPDPLRLPWIAAHLNVLDAALAELTGCAPRSRTERRESM
ncbi:pyridoxal phosphate-dependent aminotransferase [Streptomyces sp. CRN 30]|uniref:pyridoxal phosphate-dependent aminotransferase n=1 Tax=Streptomyces sp. CRN 30 TaxID=3075613 RepID=UPI002A7F0FE2|nr:pyridoxal phosphate-dependent aminotransferase [Streptomyces sp. CRN 30]